MATTSPTTAPAPNPNDYCKEDGFTIGFYNNIWQCVRKSISKIGDNCPTGYTANTDLKNCDFTYSGYNIEQNGDLTNKSTTVPNCSKYAQPSKCSVCNTGYYANTNGVCTSCTSTYPNSIECNSGSPLTCASGYIIMSNECKPRCSEDKTYVDNECKSIVTSITCPTGYIVNINKTDYYNLCISFPTSYVYSATNTNYFYLKTSDGKYLQSNGYVTYSSGWNNDGNGALSFSTTPNRHCQYQLLKETSGRYQILSRGTSYRLCYDPAYNQIVSSANPNVSDFINLCPGDPSATNYNLFKFNYIDNTNKATIQLNFNPNIQNPTAGQNPYLSNAMKGSFFTGLSTSPYEWIIEPA